ncbi:UNKNOWN [Stylonychia lemnae]|uniref:Transmembrane protein n=1 Tax=Stylonychia lemnae TaxID=5949 RepID=A0A077ZRP0_STYLE|nr:UNKNOWN [Stylonychia lemnae]|eukprot:CDW72005.1 UNKNOWN [Stylonychia lemnae]
MKANQRFSRQLPLNYIIILVLVLSVSYFVISKEITQYAGKCSLCIINKYQYCDKKCHTGNDTCTNSYLDTCKDTQSNSTLCNKLHIITSNDQGYKRILELVLGPGQWCQFMLTDDIYNALLKYTIANWSVNANNTATVTFNETNQTRRLTTDQTTNILITDYQDPLTPTTNMLLNFSHTILVYNPEVDIASRRLFSLTYSSSIINQLSWVLSAVFVQYVVYALIYIIDGFRYEAYYGEDSKSGASAAQNKAKDNKKADVKKNQDAAAENQSPADVNEVELEQQDQPNENVDGMVGQKKDAKPAAGINDSQLNNDEDSEFESAHLFVIVTKNFQKMSIWFFLLSGLCAFRAAIPLTVAMAWLQVLCRIVQLIGTMLKKRLVAKIGYLSATLFMIIMFLGVMADESQVLK